MTSRTRTATALIVSVGSCLLVGFLASLVTIPSVAEWYPQIRKPAWTPPNAAFGPVWTALYVMMGVAAWQVWRVGEESTRRQSLALFVAQLLLNAAWSFIFFGLRSPGWAAIEIFLLWVAIVATLVSFLRTSRLAAGLLLPYLVWVSYAAALNLAIWRLNP